MPIYFEDQISASYLPSYPCLGLNTNLDCASIACYKVFPTLPHIMHTKDRELYQLKSELIAKDLEMEILKHRLQVCTV